MRCRSPLPAAVHTASMASTGNYQHEGTEEQKLLSWKVFTYSAAKQEQGIIGCKSRCSSYAENKKANDQD